MRHFGQTLLIISRLALGALFVFSGFVKVIDPWGSAYKFGDYFEAFGVQSLMDTTFVLGILLATAELVMGLCLLMGMRMRVTAWAVLLFMSFFTLLTFVLALFNPVTDCGCFGDAIKLSNWQTFYKNLVIMPVALVVFYWRKRYINFGSWGTEWLLITLFVGGCFALSAYCYRHLPLLDFMPYHIGQHLPSSMSTPDDAPQAEYTITLIYEKDGVQQEFTDKNFPWQDTSWTFVDSRSTLVSQGYTPEVYNFSITHPTAGDITSEVLESEFAFVLVAPKLSTSRWERIDTIKQLARLSADRGYMFVGLTASTQSERDDFVRSHQLPFDLCTTDETTLKTMVRAHPGLILLYRGTIIGKWNYRDIPPTAFFDTHMLAGNINALRQKDEANVSHAWLGAGAAILLLLALLNAQVTHRQNTKYRN